MAWVGTTTATTGATSITYRTRSGFGKAVAIGYESYDNRCRTTAKEHPSKLASNFNPKLLLHHCGSTRRNHYYNKVKKVGLIRAAEAETMAATEVSGVKIIKNPPESKLTELDVRSWPKWGCPPSKFPWTYSSKETCYLLKGKVKVYPDGSDETVEFGAGDLVEFPKGMSCTWDVSEAVDKHYKFE